MNSNLKKIEKALRAFAKRTKDVKYTKTLLFSFLMTGTSSFGTSKGNSEIFDAKGLSQNRNILSSASFFVQMN